MCFPAQYPSQASKLYLRAIFSPLATALLTDRHQP